MSSQNRLFLAVIIVLVFAGSGGLYYYFQYQKAQQLLKNPVLAANIERDNLTQKIGALMDLPTGESPTVATIADVSKLKGQPFFAKAKNGDKLLLYSKAEKAILYDPAANKIVNVGPINIGQASPSAQPATVTVALYNGTNDTTLLASTQKKLKEKITNISIASTANPTQANYKKTIVVDLTGTKPNIAKQLAAFLGGNVDSLPKGESKPANAEILIILGK